MFNETRLLDAVAYGSEFGAEFRTRIVTLRSGAERRNVGWSMPLGRYSVLYQALQPQDHMAVRGAHMASMGSAIPFRFRDWTDFQADNQAIAIGTGSPQSAQLVKKYPFGPISLERIIKKPVTGTVVITEWDGVPGNDPTVIAATVIYTTGMVTFSATAGYTVAWSGEFDIPVRFSDDRLDVDPVAMACDSQYLLSTDVELQEIRL